MVWRHPSRDSYSVILVLAQAVINQDPDFQQNDRLLQNVAKSHPSEWFYCQSMNSLSPAVEEELPSTPQPTPSIAMLVQKRRHPFGCSLIPDSLTSYSLLL